MMRMMMMMIMMIMIVKADKWRPMEGAVHHGVPQEQVPGLPPPLPPDWQGLERG